jgi:hypothetical protein
MGSKSDFLEGKVLDHLYGATIYTPPATWYVAVFTTAPTDSGGGTEVTGGSYARVAVTNNTTNFPAASGGSKSNGTQVNYVTPTADWGIIVAFALFDAVTGGNMGPWGAVSPSKTVQNGDPTYFPAGSLTFTED